MKKYIYNNMVVLSTEGDEVPKCKICGSNLDFEKTPSRNKNSFIIRNCSNPNCECYNTKSIRVRQRAILGDEYANAMKQKKRNTNQLCVEYWLNKGLSETEAKVRIAELQSKNSNFVKNRGYTKEMMINKIGEEGAKEHYRKRSRFCIEFWTSRGYTEEEGKKEISKIQSIYSKFSNGDLEKVKKRSWRCPQYWMRVSGCTLEEAKEIISEKQVFFSKEKCIKKYGEEKGLEIWENRQKKWQETLHNSQNLHVGFSKISQEMFKKLESLYKDDEKDYIFYGSKNHEYSLRDENVNYIYDFTDLNRRKIIEFQGDIYHANPMLFEANDTPNPFKKDKTSKDLWGFDEKKKNIAVKNGFSYLTIWEKDYRENKEKEITKAKIFLGIC